MAAAALNGGGAGSAGAVAVTSYGAILTEGGLSNGIEAQSIGGGGGNGGFSIAGAFTTGTAAVGLTVGGFGSTGSAGGAVSVASYSQTAGGAALLEPPAAGVISLETLGNNSNGILAQSIGGGGGNGGFSGGLSASTDGGAFTASVGGFGAGGGSASTVDVISYNNILTKGSDSNGVLAQSLGGGGGNGGFSVGLAGGTDFGGALSVGGFALTGGGASGAVTLDSFGTVQTSGDRSNGLEAQSIGGAGGNGGFSLSGALSGANFGLTASVGGGGSAGGTGGAVTLDSNVGGTLANNNATIETQGQSANGIEAQSIGGGGGNGGFSGGFTATADAKASLSLSVGGFGAAGNTGAAVNVASVDNILTLGAGSNGILAQSIGGGGGNGGFSFAGTLSIPEGNSFTLSASLGGLGGSAGNAGTVDVTSTGIISTEANNASGVVAQSLGGGGGNGGLSVAGSFNFASSNNVPSITASVGGTGGAGGAGNNVSVTRTGATTTVGDYSFGILAQSIGGGGGNGGLSVAGSLGGANSKQISASVGGFGGAGSSAGSVTVANTGDILTGSSTTQTEQLVDIGGITVLVPASTGMTNTGTPTDVTVVTGRNADGILAQSIGGGGGNGGFAFSGSVGPTGENTNVNIGLTVGGFGGSGGTAGAVDVTNIGSVTTYGDQANGVAAQSIGGGGGNGGSAVTGLLAGGDATQGRAINVAVSVGGFGGSGNTAGAVTVNQSGGGINTFGAGANGILAQSIGGGGGNGGGANTISLQLATSCTFTLVSKVISSCKAPAKASVNAQINVGGFGGTGNDAGAVTVNNSDFITTAGTSSAGIMAQSIGGGGGDGGQAIVGLNGLFPDASYVNDALTVVTLATSTTGTLQGIGRVTVGGSGGASGAGAAVDVTNNGQIQTAGADSYGIFAQSVGGGGGIGGDASSGLTGLVSIGGAGGASGAGGDVTVTNTPSLATAAADTADILTKGFGATAIFAQSVGGGGGDGGTSGGLISLGGFLGLAGGGAAGGGGAVTVSNDSILETSGDLANGIFAQSVGGGGGTGGSPGLSVLSLGGSGGSSGDGGVVTVNNSATGTILTTGNLATAIFAQSIGGGGGDGGAGSGTLTVTVGGSGGSAGNGGAVNVTNAAVIGTTGIFSDGIWAQSVGGGGGTGGGGTLSLVSVGGTGGDSGNGGAVTVTNSGEIVTTGVESNGIFAQSVGGSGGSGGGSAYDPTTIGSIVTAANLVTIGRSGTGGGAGGAVEIDNSAIVSTGNLFSAGLFAQSVGGGGGTGGGGLGALTIGGSAGAAGNGGAVTINNALAGTIFTSGNESAGIIGQSIGGGGGAGGETYGLVAFAQNGTGGGAGGLVTIDNAALIQTTGQNSTAIFAQSVGGGGGYAAAANGLLAASGGNAGGGGNGGDIVVTNTAADILTSGANSNGIFAQSVGGGGGVVNDLKGLLLFAGTAGGTGTAGAVTVNQTGNILAIGKNAFGILGQSVGSTNGNITVTVNSGFVEGGSTGFTGVSFMGGAPAAIGQGLEGGAGVGFLDGATNLLTNSGTVTSVGRIDGFAITGTTGNDGVINKGFVIGSVDLAGGLNYFTNTPTGIFQSGTTVYLGPDGLLTNEALISPGNYGRVLTTDVTGNFIQTATGIYGLDLNFDPAADRINVTGTAAVSGKVNINILNAGLAPAGGHVVTILSAAGGETHPGLGLTFVPSAVTTYSLSYTPTDIDLNYFINFAPGGLTINQTAVGSAINRIQTTLTSPAFVPIAAALFYQPSIAALGAVYELDFGRRRLWLRADPVRRERPVPVLRRAADRGVAVRPAGYERPHGLQPVHPSAAACERRPGRRGEAGA